VIAPATKAERLAAAKRHLFQSWTTDEDNAIWRLRRALEEVIAAIEAEPEENVRAHDQVFGPPTAVLQGKITTVSRGFPEPEEKGT
jgi:hypothetical protein